MSERNPLYEEIGRFAAEYRPELPQMPSLSALSDGDYTFVVRQGGLTRTQNTGELLFKLVLQVVDGITVERPYFVSDQRQVNALGADLLALGFPDFDGRMPIDKALEKNEAKFVGVVFKGRKASRENTQNPAKPWQDLYIIGRVKSGGPAAPPPPPRQTAMPPAANSRQPAPAGAGGNSEPVPF